MPYCPKCGNEITEEMTFCTNCGASLKEGFKAPGSERYGSEAGATEHLSLAFNLAMAKPMIFAPAIIAAIISFIISRASIALVGPQWTLWQGNPFAVPVDMGLFLSASILGIIGGIIGWILNFASIDMSRDAYVDEPLNLMNSVNYVLGRIVTFILASILGALMSITIILIPVVIFMFVIIVVDETGIQNAVSRAFSVIGRDLGDVIVVIIVAIVGSIILGLIPYIGDLLTKLLMVVIGLAFMDIYYRYRQSS